MNSIAKRNSKKSAEALINTVNPMRNARRRFLESYRFIGGQTQITVYFQRRRVIDGFKGPGQSNLGLRLQNFCVFGELFEDEVKRLRAGVHFSSAT